MLLAIWTSGTSSSNDMQWLTTLLDTGLVPPIMSAFDDGFHIPILIQVMLYSMNAAHDKPFITSRLSVTGKKRHI